MVSTQRRVKWGWPLTRVSTSMTTWKSLALPCTTTCERASDRQRAVAPLDAARAAHARARGIARVDLGGGGEVPGLAQIASRLRVVELEAGVTGERVAHGAERRPRMQRRLAADGDGRRCELRRRHRALERHDRQDEAGRAAAVNAARRRLGRRPDVGEVGVRHGQADAMAGLEDPARGVDLDREIEGHAGLDGLRLAERCASRRVSHALRHERGGTVGRDVGQADCEADHARARLHPQLRPSAAEHGQRRIQRRRGVDEREGLVGPLVPGQAEQLADRVQAGLHADARLVGEQVGPGGPGSSAEAAGVAEQQHSLRQSGGRPRALCAPGPRALEPVRVGRVVALHVDDDRRLVEHAGIGARGTSGRASARPRRGSRCAAPAVPMLGTAWSQGPISIRRGTSGSRTAAAEGSDSRRASRRS